MKLRLLIILSLLMLNAHAWAQTICDMKAARDWCDSMMLSRAEGVWEYPDDHTSVLIRRSAADPSLYDMIVVDSPDTRLQPGDNIGYLRESPDPKSFEMGVYRTKKSNGVLAELGKCLARLDRENGALLVKGRKLKFSLASRWLLPAFWRMIRISVKDPLENLPKGLVKIYPETQRREPDYL